MPPPVSLSKTRFLFLASKPLQVTGSAEFFMSMFPFIVFLFISPQDALKFLNFTAETQRSQREKFLCLVAETPTSQNSSTLRVIKN